MSIVTESFNCKAISATDVMTVRPAMLGGIFVSSASNSPTITVTNAAGDATYVAQFTPVAGVFYPLPANVADGLRVAIGGTVAASVFWK